MEARRGILGQMLRTRWRRALFALLVAVASLLVTARLSARRFLFPARELATISAPRDLESRSITAKDGAPVHVLEARADGDRRTIVHFHNNRETVEGCADLARRLHRRGLGVLLVEYRGYGASAGIDTTEEGLYLDAEAALDMLAARGVGADRVVLSGVSLGTGVAAEMARRGRGSRLVLMTPYTSIPDIVTDRVPIAPAGLLVPDRFDTLAKSPSIHVPTLVVHGDADEIVPFWMGERVARAIDGARFVRVPGGHHGDLLARDADEILGAIFELSAT